VANADRPRRLAVRVIPRAARNEVGGERNGRLLVRTTAAPVDNAANDAVRKLIAKHLGVSLSRVHIESGLQGRDKVLLIDE
jgi:hypothetical protein